MTDEKLKFTRFDNAVGVWIHNRAVGNRDVECNNLSLAGLQLNALERLQFAVGPAVGGYDIADVCLYNFHAGTLAGVGEGDFGAYGVGFGEGAVGVACAARDSWLTVLECRIAQAFAECECRILGVRSA